MQRLGKREEASATKLSPAAGEHQGQQNLSMHNQMQNSSSSNYDKLCMKMFGGSGRFTDKDKNLSPAAGHLLQDSFTVPQDSNAGA